jgi:hypothetical protein
MVVLLVWFSVGSAEDAKWPVGLLWPNGRRGDLGVLVLFNFLVWLIGNAILAEDDC